MPHQYKQSEPRWFAAYWDGTDAAPIDDMLTELFDVAYEGSAADDKGVLRIEGSDGGPVRFGPGLHSLPIAPDMWLMFGPVYEGSRSDAFFELMHAETFTNKFEVTSS